MPPDVGVIVVAAGQGRRLGGELKQFRPIAGVPMLLRALRPFLAHPAVDTVVVVLPAEQTGHLPAWLGEVAGDRLRIVAGGAERADSVRAGLAVLSPACQVVLVHDGARPFPDADVIQTVIETARSGRGALAALPVGDTLKQADEGGRVLRTVPRDRLWRAQTPQGFPRHLLERAHRDGGHATDDAHLVERIGGEVVLVPDVATNLKVTTVEDLALAEAIARERGAT